MTKLLRLLLEDEAEELVRTTVNLAKGGDIQALKLCLERILPLLRDRTVSLDFPNLEDSTFSVLVLSREVVKAVVSGKITPNEGDALMAIAERFGKAVELHDLEARIIALEEITKSKGSKN